ncbi:CARDB domain-containing protein [Chloroflexota bacterium]
MKRLIFSILVIVLLFTFAGCEESVPTTTTQPAIFSLWNLTINPTEVAPNETVIISLSIENIGGSQGSTDVVFNINMTEEETKNITLAAGESKDVTFSVTRGDAGKYGVNVWLEESIGGATIGQFGSFTVMLPVSIKIETTTSTWIDWEEPYDINGIIEEKLANVGFKIISEVDKPYDALLSVIYEETKGAWYDPAGNGTNIHCSLELRDNIGNLLFEKEIYASTPESVILWEGESLYSKALDDFEDKVYFIYLGEVIATELGFDDFIVPEQD